MERIELAVAGLQQALRPRSARAAIPRIGPEDPTTQTVPPWLQVARQQVPFLAEALAAETTALTDAMAASSRRLHAERNRLLHQLQGLVPDLTSGCLGQQGTLEELRRSLLRLVRDISHHHQKVNDLLYDESWRDVGGSE
jgi:hypothetical protein